MIYQLIGKNGKSVNNHIVEKEDKKTTLFSYNTPVAIIDDEGVVLTNSWNYSATTIKHLSWFLKTELGLHDCNKTIITRALDTGIILSDPTSFKGFKTYNFIQN